MMLNNTLINNSQNSSKFNKQLPVVKTWNLQEGIISGKHRYFMQGVQITAITEHVGNPKLYSSIPV